MTTDTNTTIEDLKKTFNDRQDRSDAARANLNAKIAQLADVLTRNEAAITRLLTKGHGW